jgi:cellulose synthase/poly-beta-1,6-N-acetylglucosamine synthase-like glycosyltransferase
VAAGLPSGLRSELIVVDDASEDETPDVLADYGDRIRVVRREANGGFARACNDGAAAASGRYVVFLNNDTEPTEGWLEALVSYADETPAAGVVGSKLLYTNGTVQHAGIVITQERFPRHIYGCFPGDHPAVSKSRRFQCVTGAVALFRAELFAEAGGFDMSFHNAYEDIDLCLRLGRMGYEVHLCADSVLTHLETVTRDFSDYEENHRLYLERWGDVVEPDDLGYYVEDGLLELEYWDQFPFTLKVSPLLAEVVAPAEELTAAEIATIRAHQVFELLRENAQLRLRLLEERSRFDHALAGGVGD